jgi:hypothetical protein
MYAKNDVCIEAHPFEIIYYGVGDEGNRKGGTAKTITDF